MGNTPSKKMSRTKSKEPIPLHQDDHEGSTVDGPVPAGRLALPELQQRERDKGKSREGGGPPSSVNGDGSNTNGGEGAVGGVAPGEAVPMGINEVSIPDFSSLWEPGRFKLL